MTKYSLSAMMAAGLLAGGLSVGSANAADLGGDCCADLEERIAELEATTVRKGNRKVSLTVSGWVAQQITYWDDGVENNVYVTDVGSVSIGSHFAFSGSAQIVPGWTAGYRINVEAITNDSLASSQQTGSGNNVFGFVQGGGAFSLESSYWFIKSDKYGRVSVGQQSSAVDNQAILVDGSGSLVPANYVLYDVRSFAIRRNGGGASVPWGVLADCKTTGGGTVSADCDGYPNNSVRYDSPTFGGFSMSTSWGEDDIWGISGRYAGQIRDVKVAAAIAYVHATDENEILPRPGAAANGGLDAGHLQAGLYLQHVPTGLFVYGAYGNEDADVTASLRGAGRTNPDGENWYIKTGLRKQLNPLGHSVFYFEYGEHDDKFTSSPSINIGGTATDLDLYASGVNSSNITQYGLGVVQEIDAAAMSLWLSWRHYEADVTCDNASALAGRACSDFGFVQGSNQNFEDLDIIKFGALINF